MGVTQLPRGAIWSRPFAHRGLHDAGRPENGLTAFAAAIGHGFGIECDLQPARDGTVMVFHDEDLERMTGHRAAIRDLTAPELSRLRLKRGTDPIPTLQQLLDLTAGRVPLLIEIKDQSGDLSPEEDGFAETVVAGLRGYDGPVALMSFNPGLAAAARRLRPDLPVGLVTCGFPRLEWPEVPAARRAHLRRIADFDAVGAGFISHDRRDLGNPAVQALKARGVTVASWTIRSALQAAAAEAQGADILTFEGWLPG